MWNKHIAPIGEVVRFRYVKVEERENSQLAWPEIEENKKKKEGHNRRIRRGKWKALARPARFHGFVTFRVATRGLLTPFDCPSKRLRAPRKRSASRIHGCLFFFFFSKSYCLTDEVVDASRCALRPWLRESRTHTITSFADEQYFIAIFMAYLI